MDVDKKESILLEAARKFTQWGFKKTSIDEIAKSCGVAKGTIYLACCSKAELFYQVLLREIRKRNAEISQNIDPTRPADKLLVETTERSIELFNKYPLVRDFLFGHYHKFIPTLKNKLPELRSIAIGPIKEILEIGIKQKRFREDLNREQVANILMDLFLSTFIFHMDEKTVLSDMKERSDAAFQLIFNGILAT